MRTVPQAVVALLLTTLLGSAGIASAQTQPSAGELVTVDEVSQLFGGEWQASGGQGFGRGGVLGGGVEQPNAATGCGIHQPDAGFFCMFKAAGVVGGPTLTVWCRCQGCLARA